MASASSTFVRREVPAIQPLAAATALAGRSHAFLLHSGQPGSRGRWSYFGADPFDVFGPERYEEALRLWRDLRMRRTAVDDEPPFAGGFVGLWSYDFGRRLERLPARALDDSAWPDVWLAAYDVIGATDHATGRTWLCSSGRPERGEAAKRRAEARIAELASRLAAGAPGPATVSVRGGNRAPAPARSTFAPAAYRAAVEQVREHIRRGDIFQANLSQRWSVPHDRPAGTLGLALFRALDRLSPAPFSAWLDLGSRAVASASPERFLEVRGRRVETRPIKGTRPRGGDPAEDARLAAELRASAKDRAENVMIVDVLRNDLGRVCETGSVAVPELCALESFAQVHHLTSTVTGTLRDGRDAADLLHACFPGGSITGAPKIRAMEVIESLEPVRRGLYTGAIGWLDWGGDADWNIAIRTATVDADTVRFAAGGGITADSDPGAEYRETLDKAEGWRLAMAEVGLPVTLAEPESAVRSGEEAAALGVSRP